MAPGSNPVCGGYILCVHVAKPGCLAVWSNTHLDVAVQVFYGCNSHLQSADFEGNGHLPRGWALPNQSKDLRAKPEFSWWCRSCASRLIKKYYPSLQPALCPLSALTPQQRCSPEFAVCWPVLPPLGLPASSLSIYIYISTPLSLSLSIHLSTHASYIYVHTHTSLLVPFLWRSLTNTQPALISNILLAHSHTHSPCTIFSAVEGTCATYYNIHFSRTYGNKEDAHWTQKRSSKEGKGWRKRLGILR